MSRAKKKPQASGDRLHPQAPPRTQEAKTWSGQDGMNIMGCQQGQQSTSSAGRRHVYSIHVVKEMQTDAERKQQLKSSSTTTDADTATQLSGARER